MSAPGPLRGSVASRSRRKPYNDMAGYVCSRRARLGGVIVILDRHHTTAIDAENRWIVLHMPSTRHVSVRSLAHARAVMRGVAGAATEDEARQFADILPDEGAR